MKELLAIAAATAGGVLPCLAWLWFWLREDSEHPEPRRLIALAFVAGMISVAIAIPIEKFVEGQVNEGLFIGVSAAAATTVTFTLWSIIEEALKFFFAYATVLRRKEDDEPIDPVIYMVTVALGFAAAENTLFLLSPLSGSTVYQEILTGDLRFVGATLLHVLSSSVIGVAFGLTFYKPHWVRVVAGIIGVALASTLHATFNFFILNTPEDNLLRTFAVVWFGIVILIGSLEYIKRIRPSRV